VIDSAAATLDASQDETTAPTAQDLNQPQRNRRAMRTAHAGRSRLGWMPAGWSTPADPIRQHSPATADT